MVDKLADLLRSSVDPRVIFGKRTNCIVIANDCERFSSLFSVSSGGGITEPLCTTDEQYHSGKYDGTVAYARTKRMQVMMDVVCLSWITIMTFCLLFVVCRLFWAIIMLECIRTFSLPQCILDGVIHQVIKSITIIVYFCQFLLIVRIRCESVHAWILRQIWIKISHCCARYGDPAIDIFSLFLFLCSHTHTIHFPAGADTITWLSSCVPRPNPNGSFWRDRGVELEHFTFGGTAYELEREQQLYEWLRAKWINLIH
jgi:hypothetical protein